MERNILRYGIAAIISVILFPAASIAGSRPVFVPERPAERGISRPQTRLEGATRLLAFLREVFGDWGSDEGRTEGRPEKDLENRAGIDPNGNS